MFAFFDSLYWFIYDYIFSILELVIYEFSSTEDISYLFILGVDGTFETKYFETEILSHILAFVLFILILSVFIYFVYKTIFWIIRRFRL